MSAKLSSNWWTKWPLQLLVLPSFGNVTARLETFIVIDTEHIKLWIIHRHEQVKLLNIIIFFSIYCLTHPLQLAIYASLSTFSPLISFCKILHISYPISCLLWEIMLDTKKLSVLPSFSFLFIFELIFAYGALCIFWNMIFSCFTGYLCWRRKSDQNWVWLFGWWAFRFVMLWACLSWSTYSDYRKRCAHGDFLMVPVYFLQLSGYPLQVCSKLSFIGSPASHCLCS